MSFTNKVVVVTGASSGIGAATAILFAKEGADVVIVGRNDVKLKSVEAQCEKVGKKPLRIIADISKEDQAVSIIDQTIEKLEKIDVLINNAGILRLGTISDGTFLKIYDELVGTNLRPVIHLTTLATPHLIKTKGNIINLSIAGTKRVKHPLFLAYTISKAAINVFTQGAALELSAHGIRVNTISPGPVVTELWASVPLPPGVKQSADLKLPLNRLSKPEEIADLALYLAGDKAIGITGSNFVVDNGFILQ